MQSSLTNLSVRVRLTLWYTAFLAGALVLFAVGVYLLMSHSLLVNLDTSLHARVNQIVPAITVTRGRAHLPAKGEDADAPYIPVALLTATGRPDLGPLPIAFKGWLRQHRYTLSPGFHAATAADLRFATISIEGRHAIVGYLVVWQSLHAVDEARRSLLLFLLTIGAAMLLLAAGGGMILARRALRPVAELTFAASNISVTDLHRRVAVGADRDELTELAHTFNAMIERLESAVERERRFTADASHELRSPLAVILAEVSLALEDPLEPEEYRRALQVVHEQAAGMHEMIAALLMLARMETIQSQREVVSMADITERAMRQCDLVSRDRNVCVMANVNRALHVEGNATLLTRAVRNVLDNAIKVSSPGDVVRVQAHREGTMVVLGIQDRGPGIALDHLERIFEPFYQVARARTPGDSHGLGLAICRRVIQVHGGEVRASSREGEGAYFSILLPATDVPGHSGYTAGEGVHGGR